MGTSPLKSLAVSIVLLSCLVSVIHLEDTGEESLLRSGSLYDAFAVTLAVSDPDPPRNLTLLPGPDYVDISWEPPLNDGGAPIVGYDVLKGSEYFDTYGNYVISLTVLVSLPASSLSYHDTDVSIGGKYYYSARASNGHNHSYAVDATWALVGGTIPNAPLNLNATGGGGQVNLSWIVPFHQGGTEVRSYRVYRGISESNFSLVALVDLPTGLHNVPDYMMRWTDAGLVNGQTYYYSISANNSVGEGPMCSVRSVRPNFAPNLGGFADSNCRELNVMLAWGHLTVNQSEILCYRIYHQEHHQIYGDIWLFVATVSNSTTSFNETLDYSFTQEYRIAAVYPGGYEVYSEAAIVYGGYCEGGYFSWPDLVSIVLIMIITTSLLVMVFIALKRRR